MMHPLDDARQKLDRGKTQLDTLYKQLRAALDSNRHTVKTEIHVGLTSKPPGVTDSRPWVAYTYRVVEIPTFEAEIGLLLGEVVHNFRGALDHLAWALVRRGSQRHITRSQTRNVMFPMAPTRKSFFNSVGNRLPGTSMDQRAFIEQYQPYRRSTAGRAIRRLQSLSNTDKHRVIVPTFITSLAADLDFKHDGGELVAAVVHTKDMRSIKNGSRIMSLVLAVEGTDEIKVNVSGNLRLLPALPRSVARPNPGDDALPLELAFRDISAVCSEIVDEIEID